MEIISLKRANHPLQIGLKKFLKFFFLLLENVANIFVKLMAPSYNNVKPDCGYILKPKCRLTALKMIGSNPVKIF
jgi:hypothetical protein